MKKARLIHGCGSDSYYAIKMEVPDAYTWYQDTKGETHVILSALEVGRGRKNAKADHVHALSDLMDAAPKGSDGRSASSAVVAHFIQQDNPDVVEVPADFPSGMFAELKALGIPVEPVKGFFFPERAIKSPKEIEMVRTAQHNNQRGFERAFAILAEAKIEADNSLSWNSKPLTSEILRGEMNAELAKYGSIPMEGGPIIACGAQGADPHERGHGLLYAHEFIIIDSFPRSDNFYYGDLTRTVLKGTPTQWHLDVYEAVLAAQQRGLDDIKAGAIVADVHNAVDTEMQNRGFDTGVDDNGTPYGFFHSTGHALGLDVHDKGPGVHKNRDTAFEAGEVVTVEPGLYYPGKGGARIEDIVTVTDNGIDNLTTLKKELVIP